MRSGVTLLELLLVLAILVILAGIAFFNFDTAYDEVKLNSAADAVRRAWAQSRAEAIDTGVAYRFAVMPNTSRFRIAPDLPEYWFSSGAAAPDVSESGQQLPIIEDELPEKIVFDFGGGGEDAAGSDWVAVLSFLPQGNASDNRDVTLRYKNSRPVRVSIRALTGTVKIAPVNTGGSP
jgi:prepilin-type N-terminal cleavage/methylation domain-containing protein